MQKVYLVLHKDYAPTQTSGLYTDKESAHKDVYLSNKQWLDYNKPTDDIIELPWYVLELTLNDLPPESISI